MWKFILCSFAFLGWGFYELSGGSDFTPPPAKSRVAANLGTYDVPEQPEPVVETPVAVSLPVVEAPVVEDTQEAEIQVTSALAALETYSPEVTDNAAAAIEPVAVERDVDLRLVDANRVNMRNGPSTNFQVIAKLARGDEVEVLQTPGDGWVKLRVVSTGRVGWMAERLLTASSN